MEKDGDRTNEHDSGHFTTNPIAKATESLTELSLEKLTNSAKSPEEIDRCTVDPSFTDIERSVYLLSSGQEVQRISVIINLPQLLQDSNAEAMRRVVPKVREVLHVAGREVQEVATKAFYTIIEQEFVTYTVYTQTFLQSILLSIDNRDLVVANAWLDTLLQVIDLLPRDIIKREILTVAVNKGQLSQSVHSRLSSCRILGKISTKFDSFMLKKEVLPLVQTLCQDVEYEVRGCMCRQLDTLARGLGLEATKSAILPELVELSNDEESYVRLAALETLVNLLSLLDDDICTQVIVPLVCKFYDNAFAHNDATLPSISKQFGRLCHGLSVNLTDEQKVWFVLFYKRLCVMGLDSLKNANEDLATIISICDSAEEKNAECRRCAAFNFPCMVLFVGPRNFKSELYSSFTSLAYDPDYLVRKTVAAGFHEVAKLLGSSVVMIQGELINLFHDDNPEVIQGIVSHLPETLEILAKGGGNVVTESKLTGMTELIPAILAAQSLLASTRNWRLHAQMIQQLSCLPKCLTSDQIYYKFVPVVLRVLSQARALPVKLMAARTICTLIRHNRRLDQRQELCCRLIEEYCHASSSSKRVLFVDICQVVVDMYSRRFFKEYFFEFLLELAQDPVANVRLKFCSLLAVLKAQMKLPADRHLLQQLEQAIRTLMAHEMDRDVSQAIRTAVIELDKIQISVESAQNYQYGSYFPDMYQGQVFQNEDDIADQKKEEEEKLLIEMEEREKEENSKSGQSSKTSKKGADSKTTTKKGAKNIGGKKNPGIPSSSNASPDVSGNKTGNKSKSSGKAFSNSYGSSSSTSSPKSSQKNSESAESTRLHSATSHSKKIGTARINSYHNVTATYLPRASSDSGNNLSQAAQIAIKRSQVLSPTGESTSSKATTRSKTGVSRSDGKLRPKKTGKS